MRTPDISLIVAPYIPLTSLLSSDYWMMTAVSSFLNNLKSAVKRYKVMVPPFHAESPIRALIGKSPFYIEDLRSYIFGQNGTTRQDV